MSGTQMTAAQQAAQQNAYARSVIFSQAKPIIQLVTQKTFTNVATGNNQMQVNPLQVGFLRRFLVEITGTISNTDTVASLVLTPNGADNFLSNVTFNDFTGNPRHNASGRSFSFVEAAKYQRIPGAALTSDSVEGFGSNVKSNVAPLVSTGTTGVFTRVFEIPIMVDNGRNMAGGMYLGVNNQSTLLNLTINPTPIGANGADPLNYVYTLGSGGTAIATTPITSCTVKVFQEYWNNIPRDKSDNLILPQQDLSTAYLITETNSGMTFATGQASSWNFPTFSKMLGTYLVFDNGGTMNAGTDISQISLVVSNYSILRQYDPVTLDRLTRDACGASFPKGCYPIMSRTHNLDVTQYPSLQLQVTPTGTISASSLMLITTELLRPVQYMAAASGMGGT